jgi:hypothetical protein
MFGINLIWVSINTKFDAEFQSVGKLKGKNFYTQ